MTRAAILAQIDAERERQIEKWGGPVKSAFIDDSWNALDWKEMIDDYTAWARRMATMGSWDKSRRRFIQVAALAVAAVEAIDRLHTAADGD